MISRNRTKLNWALGACLVLLALAPSHAVSQDDGNTRSADVFKENCAACHGNDGAGSPLGRRLHTPDLRSKEIHQKPTEKLVHAISAGGDKMPPFGTQLSADQISALVDYVRSLHMPGAMK